MTEDNVARLNCAANNIIKTLEEMLEQAKTGGFNGLIVAATKLDGGGSTAVVIEPETPRFELLGLAEAARCRAVMEADPMVQLIIGHFGRGGPD